MNSTVSPVDSQQVWFDQCPFVNHQTVESASHCFCEAISWSVSPKTVSQWVLNHWTSELASQSPERSVTWWVIHWVKESAPWQIRVSLSVLQRENEWASMPTTVSVSPSNSQSVTQQVSWWVSQSISMSVCQSVGQSVSQSVNQSVNYWC